MTKRLLFINPDLAGVMKDVCCQVTAWLLLADEQIKELNSNQIPAVFFCFFLTGFLFFVLYLIIFLPDSYQAF